MEGIRYPFLIGQKKKLRASSAKARAGANPQKK
jgi:hypothetical protein